MSSTLAPELTSAAVSRISASILDLLIPYRRTTDRGVVPASAFAPQLRLLTDFVERGDPILFTLPGFPCKSPNPAKVLGHLPDRGECLSLVFLDQLCLRIQEIYEPGARIAICSDGHIFGDLIRVPDEHIDAYSDELRTIIRQQGLDRLSVFDLRDVYGDLSHDTKRVQAHEQYAPTVQELRAEIRQDENTLQLYRGITRFLVEDTVGFRGTKSALQRECRQRAYSVIQRSRAWGDLIADHHTRSVRLSIHPQTVGAPKFGIRLLDAQDAWTTPWHSAALRKPNGTWELMPRAKAQQLGRLVWQDGRPSHYEAFAS